MSAWAWMALCFTYLLVGVYMGVVYERDRQQGTREGGGSK